jgi:hypothetical protein
MLKNNIKYKQVVRLQLFGDDNVYNKVQYQYSTIGTLPTAIINSIRMRFELKGHLAEVILSKNARIVVESACLPALTNMTSRYALVRLVTSTEDKVFDSKKGINGNPILFSLGTGTGAGSMTNFSNGYDMFYSLSIPSNFLSKGFIEMELEVPTQTTSAISFIGTLLNNLCIHFIIIDVDPELTLDNTLAPPFQLKNYNNNFPINQY